jgi:hypothetical protein
LYRRIRTPFLDTGYAKECGRLMKWS